MKPTFLLPFAALFSTNVFAAPETYVIDSTHTLPRFSYSHFGYSTQLSRFDKTTGKIVLDRQAKTGSIDVTVDTTSVNTGYALFNEHIQCADFLDNGHYPTMTFQSNTLKFDGDNLIRVEGTLTLKGVSKPLTLTVTSFQCMPHPMLKKDACGVNASAVLNRSDFKPGKYAPHVSDEVTDTNPVEAVKE